MPPNVDLAIHVSEGWFETGQNVQVRLQIAQALLSVEGSVDDRGTFRIWV